MKVNRRKTLGILAGAVAGAGAVSAQAPTPRPAETTNAPLQSARQSYQLDAQRIGMVKLPQATEPAFRFQP